MDNTKKRIETLEKAVEALREAQDKIKYTFSRQQIALEAITKMLEEMSAAKSGPPVVLN